MYDRFTHESRTGRGKIAREIREEVFLRDRHTCQFCGTTLPASRLTIDHLIPLALGGLDEVTNYVTACEPCNVRKGKLPFAQFAASLNLNPEALPVHGDPILSNEALPIQIRIIRRRVFDRIHEGKLKAAGKSAQRKIEKAYRRSLWETPIGKQLDSELPLLPGQVRAMVPEICTIAKSEQEYLLLIELAKSANTRNLIGSVLTSDCDVLARVESLRTRSPDEALKKRIGFALRRFGHELRRHGLPQANDQSGANADQQRGTEKFP
jgi:hypothetical protein